ncbi:Hpt domain-containing protein [Baaleninema sp.]|uniref:Hpt domain-containing protein n=1 Tax=Baaleninema sp. TaxID=3101197 RepID=UPI003CFD5631
MASEEIVRFFIEEGKEHLNTLENGLLDLQATVKDPEQVNELFRAAHSVKGGAAMLGYGSIQKVAHRLEDYFKVLRDNPINVDRQLESLFLKGMDALRELLELLQGPFGLRDEDAERTIAEVEPVFEQLQEHLNHLVEGGGAVEAPAAATAEEDEIPSDFAEQVIEILRQMLQVFKKAESSDTREKLSSFCQHLQELGEASEGWTSLVEAVDRSIDNTHNPYRILAPVAIVELRQNAERLADDPQAEIAPSASLMHLAEMESGAWTDYILVRNEPKAAFQSLTQVMEKPQLLKLAKLLYKASQS